MPSVCVDSSYVTYLCGKTGSKQCGYSKCARDDRKGDQNRALPTRRFGQAPGRLTHSVPHTCIIDRPGSALPRSEG